MLPAIVHFSAATTQALLFSYVAHNIQSLPHTPTQHMHTTYIFMMSICRKNHTGNGKNKHRFDIIHAWHVRGCPRTHTHAHKWPVFGKIRVARQTILYVLWVEGYHFRLPLPYICRLAAELRKPLWRRTNDYATRVTYTVLAASRWTWHCCSTLTIGHEICIESSTRKLLVGCCPISKHLINSVTTF